MKRRQASRRAYQAVEIPPELESVVERALRQGRTCRRWRVRPLWSAAAMLLLGFIALLNVSRAFAELVGEVPLLGPLARLCTIREYSRSNGDDEVNVRIPALAGTGNPALEERINAEILQRMNDQVAAAERRAREAREARIATGGDPNEVIPVFIDIDYELKYTSVERISFVVTKTETLANAYSEQYFYNLALPDGRDLQLSDLLGPDFKRIVDAEVERQIAERGKDPDIVFFEGENGFRGIDDRQKFFIDADGQVVVVFAKYEIAPGSMGIQTFKIPAPLPGNSSGR